MDNKTAQAKKSRAKYITLAILLAWVIGVFVFTFFKLPGGWK
jgi:hypothetical protein